MSIELAKGDTLQRVYFAVEDKEVLRASVKERLKWEVDRSSASNKHRDFIKWAAEVCADIRYQRKLQSHPLCRALVNNWRVFNLAVILLSFTINVVMLLGWAAPSTNYSFSVAQQRFRVSISIHQATIRDSLMGGWGVRHGPCPPLPLYTGLTITLFAASHLDRNANGGVDPGPDRDSALPGLVRLLPPR